MAMNDDIQFLDCQDEPWVDSGGMYMESPSPCVRCRTSTHRWDTLAEGPVCNDGTDNSCSETLWKLHHSLWGLDGIMQDG